MNWKTKLKNPNFWTAIAGAAVIILRAFGIDMGGYLSESVISAVCGLLVVFGIFNDNGAAKSAADKIAEIADELADDETDSASKDKNAED